MKNHIILAACLGLAQAKPIVPTNSSADSSALLEEPHDRNLARSLVCDIYRNNLTPGYIPEGTYKSGAGNSYYPIGDQKGHILTAKFPGVEGLYAAGDGGWPESNNFATAVRKCTELCDGNPKCKSFNVLTVHEDGFNGCIPTWQCRFANKHYDPEDYKVSNGPASYVWSRQPYVPKEPDCSFARRADISPAAWTQRNMDGYLATLASKLNIMPNSENFLSDLMEAFSWPGYMCLGDDMHFCHDTSTLKTCGEWVNRQNLVFQGYMANNEDILRTLVTKLQTIGADIFQRSWWLTNGPPKSPKFDPNDLIFTAINTLVGVVPKVGKVAKVGLTEVEKLLGKKSEPPVGVTPRDASSWASFMASVQRGVDAAVNAINDAARAATQTSDFLSVIEGGTWSVNDPQSTTFMPSVDQFWDQVSPYYASRVAMEAIKAQNVFFLTASANLVPGEDGICTQRIADKAAAMINDGPKGVAFCGGDGDIVIPVMGWNQQVFGSWNDLVAAAGTTSDAIYRTSLPCGSGTQAGGKALYAADFQLPTQQGGKLSFDMKKTCTWSIPHCNVNIWKGMWPNWGPPPKDHSKAGVIQPTTGDILMNGLKSCAYNWNMVIGRHTLVRRLRIFYKRNG